MGGGMKFLLEVSVLALGCFRFSRFGIIGDALLDHRWLKRSNLRSLIQEKVQVVLA